MTSRNPKDLKQIVAASQKDMSDMQTALDKLNQLSSDDKTEAAMLRSRIEEQSSLIMMLKKRADETSERNKVLERIQEELVHFRDHAEEQLDIEIKKQVMLESRFNDLADNHAQMIQFKDQYKQMNEKLRKENEKLKQENEKLFSKAINDRDEKINQLENNLIAMRNSIVTLEGKYKTSQSALQEQYNTLQKDLESKEHKFAMEIKLLQSKLYESEERLKGTSAKLKYQIESKESGDLDTNSKIQQLRKEKDEMLELAMQRGKLVAEKVSDNKKLQKRVEEMEKSVRDMQNKFEREATTVDANLQVKKLRRELETAVGRLNEIDKEFDAYKKHANNLLKKEKELNERLRHLVG